MKELKKHKIIRLSWFSKFGLEIYYFSPNDAIKVIEQMQDKYWPINIKIEYGYNYKWKATYAN